jgi:hypothetical protein
MLQNINAYFSIKSVPQGKASFRCFEMVEIRNRSIFGLTKT